MCSVSCEQGAKTDTCQREKKKKYEERERETQAFPRESAGHVLCVFSTICEVPMSNADDFLRVWCVSVVLSVTTRM